MEGEIVMKRKWAVYFKTTPIHRLEEDEYLALKDSGLFYEYYPAATGIYDDDVEQSRIDFIGQNGNDGLHYDDAQGWPYEHGDMYIDKVNNVTQEHFDEFVGCMHEWEVWYWNANKDWYKCKKCGETRSEK